MSQIISGPGLGLPLPQSLYPTELYNAPADFSTNQVGLAPGDSLVLPAGTWYVSLGSYSILEYLDPVNNTWHVMPACAWSQAPIYVKSDGFTVRVANMTGCPVSASVTAYGSGYVQASTTITAVGSTSTWAPVIGGQLALSGGTLTSVGAGYGLPPQVIIPAPPGPAGNPNGVGGVTAAGWCGIASGTVSFFSFSNPGAGYPTAPGPITLYASPFDPNLATGITLATVTFSLTGSGSLTAALCTNPGAPLTNGSMGNMTLTVAGAGTNATVVPNVMQTLVQASVTGAGVGYGTTAALLTTVGGTASAGTVTNSPLFRGLAFRPRPAQVGLAPTGAGGTVAAQNGTIYDGGLFLSQPNPVYAYQPLTAATVAITAATVSLTYGSRDDYVALQPAP